MSQLEPRRLRLATLDDALREVDHLHSAGYDQAGQWNLSQTCEHLADWMSYPMDGFPKSPFLVGILLGVMRKVQGKTLLHRFIESQSMPRNQPTIPQSVHQDRGHDADSIARLKSMIARLVEHRGTIHPSPLFGPMSRAELIGVQLAHCAHHLNFLIPKTCRDASL